MKASASHVTTLVLLAALHLFGQQSGDLKITVQGGQAGQSTGERKQAPEVLDNDAILKLLKAGLGEQTIITMINTQPGKYSVGADDIIALKNAGASDRIVTAILSKPASAAASAQALGSERGPARTNASGASAQQPQPATYAGSEIDNARILQMTQLGLGDDIIIARIKTGNCKFSLSDTDLAELKRANVSEKVIAAMLEASVLTRPRVTVDGNPAELHTIGQEKIGGRLGHAVSLHIKSVKEKAYLQGQHASLFASSKPVVRIELPPSNTIDDYILVRMDGKGDRRELELESGGGAVGHKIGIRSDRVMKTSYEPISGRLYKLTVEEPLKGGEYILYIVGSADYEKGIFGRGYDFTVE